MKKLFLLVILFVGSKSFAQTNALLTYGEPIKLEQAEKVMTAALQEATKNNWLMAIAIVDTSGKLVLFKKIDNTQIGSVDIAIGKAATANNFKRASKVFEDAVAGGGIGLRVLSIPNVTPLEGGELILYKGKIIGAIGVSGALSTQDGQVARAGASVIN
jgi:uncharacterized protein GlcG (DUF336 family)